MNQQGNWYTIEELEKMKEKKMINEELTKRYPDAFASEMTKVIYNGEKVAEYQKLLSNLLLKRAIEILGGEKNLVELAVRQFNTDASNNIRTLYCSCSRPVEDQSGGEKEKGK